MQLDFVKTYRKITATGRMGVAVGQEGSQKFGVPDPLYYSAMAEASNFKFGMQLKFAKVEEGKLGVVLRLVQHYGLDRTSKTAKVRTADYGARHDDVLYN